MSAHVEDTGYAFGLRYVLPVSYRAKPWVRAGGLYNHVEIEGSSDGLLVADSKHTLGLEAGGGLEVALGGPWSLTPGFRYRRFEPTVRFGGVESSTTLSDVTFDVGTVLLDRSAIDTSSSADSSRRSPRRSASSNKRFTRATIASSRESLISITTARWSCGASHVNYVAVITGPKGREPHRGSW